MNRAVRTLSLQISIHLTWLCSLSRRIWYADAWTVTSALHGIVSWCLMHWVKGNADFYGQGECNAMTWYEQLLHSEEAR